MEETKFTDTPPAGEGAFALSSDDTTTFCTNPESASTVVTVGTSTGAVDDSETATKLAGVVLDEPTTLSETRGAGAAAPPLTNSADEEPPPMETLSASSEATPAPLSASTKPLFSTAFALTPAKFPSRALLMACSASSLVRYLMK